MEYKLARLAQAHLQDIKTYTLENFGTAQWQKYKADLFAGFQRLADNPNIGIGCAEIYPEGFYFPIKKHVAYYTKEREFIFIVALLGQSQLPYKHLKKI